MQPIFLKKVAPENIKKIAHDVSVPISESLDDVQSVGLNTVFGVSLKVFFGHVWHHCSVQCCASRFCFNSWKTFDLNSCFATLLKQLQKTFSILMRNSHCCLCTI